MFNQDIESECVGKALSVFPCFRSYTAVLIHLSLCLPSIFPLSSLPSAAPCLHVSTQSGRRNEDYEYREAAQDDPHYSEPDGCPPRFQCESEVKRRAALQLTRRRAGLVCADCTEAAANKVEMHYLRSNAQALFFYVNKKRCGDAGR